MSNFYTTSDVLFTQDYVFYTGFGLDRFHWLYMYIDYIPCHVQWPSISIINIRDMWYCYWVVWNI